MGGESIERVLIVEDDERLLRAMESALSDRFAELRSASTTAQALQILEHFSPQLMVMDVELPDGTAIDVMRAAVRGAPVPLTLAMSGAATPAEGFDLARLGVRTFLSKPFELAELERAIDEVIATPAELNPQFRTLVGQRSIHEVEEELRETMLKEAMARSGGNKRGAARLLRVSRQLIQHMLRRFDLS